MKLMKKALSLILTMAMVLSMMTVVVWAEESENSKIALADCTVIGESGDMGCSYYYIDIKDASKTVEFTDLEGKMTSDLSFLCQPNSSTYLMKTNVANLAAGFHVDAEEVLEGCADDFNAEAIADLEMTNLYYVLAADDDGNYYIFIIQADEGPVATGMLEDDEFSVTVNGEDMPEITGMTYSYDYYDYMAGETISVPLFTVKVPADATEATLKLENESLVYNYDFAGNYLAGWVTDYAKGATEVTVKLDANADGAIDAIQIQNPYNEDYSGGELRYAVTFVKDEVFEVVAGDATMTEITRVPNGYTYFDYMASANVDVTLFKVWVPADTTEVTLKLPKESLVYNYDFAGNYLAGWVTDYTKGATEVTVKLDANEDGSIDAIQIQNPYNEDYSGGELRYAITFVKDEPFEVVVGDATMTEITRTPNGYAYFDYMANKTVYVPLFEVVVPDDATEATLKLSKESLVYNYEAGEYLAGWVDDYTKGAAEVTVKVDSNSNCVMDSIQIQNPYNADYTGGELRYAIVFKKADPHTVQRVVVTPATLTEDGTAVIECATCGESYAGEAIPHAASVKLSYTSTTYSGKAKKPTVTVKTAEGIAIDASNYTVTYGTNKSVGKGTVKITGTDDYNFTKTLTFKINPVKTSIKSLTKGTKSFTVKWAKKTTQVTGYQVRYSTSKSFKSYKTATITKNSTTSKKISNLKAKTKYYVQVRTYKTVSKTKYYSAWSTAKYVTTK